MSTKMGTFVIKSEDSDKTRLAVLPVVDVAVAVIIREKRILAVYNEKWGSFTLPMSKLKSWQMQEGSKTSERIEEWPAAAVRAAAEALGRTITEQPDLLSELGEFQQSDRDGKWKRYHLQAYRFRISQDVAVNPIRVVEWLTPEQLLDEKREPISPTARYAINELSLSALV